MFFSIQGTKPPTMPPSPVAPVAPVATVPKPKIQSNYGELNQFSFNK